MDLQPERSTHGGSQKRAAMAVAGLFFAVALLAGIDVFTDFGEGTTAGHVVVEASVVLAGLAGFVVAARWVTGLQRREEAARSEAAELGSRLAAVQAEATRWRTEAKDLLQGLGAAIERQLVRWGLTAAEKEVALLLLKGLSHKKVAELRSVGDATVRQQSRGIYKKAGVEGRHDLAAFFLEGLLVPGYEQE